MLDGKKSAAEQIMYGAFDIIEQKTKQDPLKVFHEAIDNVKPAVEVRSRRVGGATYQVPVEVRHDRQQALAIRWLVDIARKRSENTMMERLSGELLDGFQQPRFRGQEARGHPPDGGGQQGLFALSMVA